MTGITFYDAYFPTLIRAFNSFEAILTKAQVHAKENGINFDTEYASAKLYEDMLPLTFQIQISSLQVKAVVRTLIGAAAEDPKKDQTTFEQLLALIKETRELVESVRPEDVNGKEDQEKEFVLGPRARKMVSRDCITRFLFPNLYFHLSTTYAILRAKGVPLGKLDYLTSFLA